MLRELRKLAQPTIAFHVRGGDLLSAADEQLFNVISHPPCACACCNPTALSSGLPLFSHAELPFWLMQDAPDSKAKDMVDTFLETYPDVRVRPPDLSDASYLYICSTWAVVTLQCHQADMPHSRVLAPQQGGACIFVGDDHKLIDETAAIASKALTCKIVKRRKFHKKSGFVQVQLLNSLAKMITLSSPAVRLPKLAVLMQADFNQEPLEQRCQSSKHLIADMELMAHADYFIGRAITFSMGMYLHVQFMRMTMPCKRRQLGFQSAAHCPDDALCAVPERSKDICGCIGQAP